MITKKNSFHFSIYTKELNSIVTTIDHCEIKKARRMFINSTVTLLTIFLVFNVIVEISCREALNPDEDIGFPPITDMSESLREKLIESHTQVPCIIEYQITKRKIGECGKLTGSIRGCVSDSLVNPFHPDCLSSVTW
ncbi:Protein of unknown function [Cotesia congregata]|uniref:Uncharacterized protein n=1 Tax=Cotesia congregata TaxID=51543 RepID=A0A8J2MJV4_COTCN|nr:Protein of unknown function [Cotesia congregata]